MLSCEEFCRQLAADELVDGGLRQRLAALAHRLLCARCQSYASDLKRIAEGARGAARRASENSRGDAETAQLDRLKRDLVERARGD